MAIVNSTNDSFAGDVKDGVVLVDFWAPWCGPCKMIAPVLDELDGELDGKASIVKVNVEEASDIAAQYGVQSIPTLMIFKNGEMAEKTVGFKPKEVLVELIDKHV